MRYLLRALGVAALITVAANATARADDDRDRNAYQVTVLVSNLAGVATHQDPVLQDAWGVAFSPSGGPFWVNDNDTGCATIYKGDGTKLGLQISLPLPGGLVAPDSCQPFDFNNPSAVTPAAPTGMIWNPSSAFLVPGTKIPAEFVFDTEDGTLSAWAGGLSPPTQAVLAVDNSANPTAATGAVYKGLAFAVNSHGAFLFATNFRAGRIDVFGPNGADGLFTAATTDGGFVDADIPAGYAPFGIFLIDGDLFVTYALQNAQKHDDLPGPGRGFVDVFDTDGHLLRRFASRGPLDAPWGVTRASFAFGKFSGKILIGNFGNGQISAFGDRGEFLGELEDGYNRPVRIGGLWTLTLGGGGGSSPDTLFFTAGPQDETNGLFGTITPAPGSTDHGE
jgi:uncharacterized protein (TIGR03118 family)